MILLIHFSKSVKWLPITVSMQSAWLILSIIWLIFYLVWTFLINFKPFKFNTVNQMIKQVTIYCKKERWRGMSTVRHILDIIFEEDEWLPSFHGWKLYLSPSKIQSLLSKKMQNGFFDHTQVDPPKQHQWPRSPPALSSSPAPGPSLVSADRRSGDGRGAGCRRRRRRSRSGTVARRRRTALCRRSSSRWTSTGRWRRRSPSRGRRRTSPTSAPASSSSAAPSPSSLASPSPGSASSTLTATPSNPPSPPPPLVSWPTPSSSSASTSAGPTSATASSAPPSSVSSEQSSHQQLKTLLKIRSFLLRTFFFSVVCDRLIDVFVGLQMKKRVGMMVRYYY